MDPNTQMAFLAYEQIPHDHNLEHLLQDDQQYAPDDSGGGDGGSGGKRKADGETAGQRAKRNRYTSIACNECKRRKIKCNGQTPCQRCGNLNLECVYAPNCCTGFKDSQEYKDMSAQISMLQEQVNTLYHDLSSLRNMLGQSEPQQQQQQQQMQQQSQQPQHLAPTPPPRPSQAQMQQQSTSIDPSLQSAPFPSHRPSFSASQASQGASAMISYPPRPTSKSRNKRLSFRGPTSNEFNFGVAENSLQTMGMTARQVDDGSGDAGTASALTSPPRSPNLPVFPAGQVFPVLHAQKDPIWSIPEEEALRLCRVYEDEMGLMYPVLDIEKVTSHTKKLYSFMRAAHRTGLMQQGLPGADSIEDEDTNILKLVLATALTVEGTGRSDLGQRLFEIVQPAVDNLLLGTVGVKGIRLLTLTAMYEFQCDNEGTSWRIIGLTARLCIELGLHRRESYDAMPNDNERSETVLLFWAIYVLDRRWSFGTGMPFALQDADIDQQLPKPEDQSPYLSAMIQYSAIGSKVWRSVGTSPMPASGGSINTEEMDYLDYQVVQWHRNVPVQLRFEHPLQQGHPSTPAAAPPSRATHRLRILLYLRGNQMRILIYRFVLHSATSILQHREQAQKVVDVAKDTIRVLTHINHTSDMYRSQQVLFNAFLTSALAVLFLAVSHAPALFAEGVRDEFNMALELVRGFSKGSWVGKRLWKTIRVLKEVGPKLGMAIKDNSVAHQSHSNPVKGVLDPSRSAAVAMAGLAGHNVDEMALYPDTAGPWTTTTAGPSTSPDEMANDLTSLFEAAGGLYGLSNGATADGSGGLFGAAGFDGSGQFGEDGLAAILKELF